MNCCVFQNESTETETKPTEEDQVLRDETDFIKQVSRFFNQEDLSDIILKVDDQSFYGHKFVLAKSSDVFRAMLYDKNWTEEGKNELVLNETPECIPVFKEFLQYLYTAEVHVSTSTSVGVLCLADKYGVTALKDLVAKYMVDNSRSPRVHNAWSWYSWAKALSLELLIKQCTKTLAWNMQEIISSADWFELHFDLVYDLYQSSELVVKDEYCLFEALSDWLSHESHSERITEYAAKLLPLVRFPQMTVNELYMVEKCPLSSNPECSDLLSSLIGRAYRFRSLCPSQAQLNVSFEEDFYMPRDYSGLTVDNVRMQNTLRFGIQVDVKMYRGPVPSDIRDGDWKITYRKTNNTWSLQMYCHDSAMVNSEAHFQASIVIFNENEKVIQVERTQTNVCTRGTNINIQVNVNEPNDAKSMAVIIKPVPL